LRIDSHHSFTAQYSLQNLEIILKRNRFEGSVLVHHTLSVETPEIVKAIVLETAVPDAALLDAAARHPLFRGVRTASAEGLGELERRRIPLDFSGDLRLLPSIAARHPGLRIVVDHLGGPPFDGWDRALEAAAQIPLLCCKLSGLMRCNTSPRPFVQHALALFGPHRLMFGSDWPHALPDHSWKANLAAFTQAIGAQTIETREELLGGVASRFYAL
jgi:predicted TIM-barrel fold metal-dependent hydrolase